MSWYKKVDHSQMILGPLKTFSFSGLKEYEVCAFKRYLKKVGGYRGESGPAATRGKEYHDIIEQFIRGNTDALPKIKEDARVFIEGLRDEFPNGHIILEEDWFIDREWKQCAKEDFWGIFIIDCYIKESDTSAKIIDWKTGKSRGNEMKHAEQLMFYAIAAFERHPELEYVTVGAWYVDEGHLSCERGYTREQLKPMKEIVTKRALAMTTALEFPPNPSKFNCKWCDFKTMEDDNGNPLCHWGVV